MERDENGRALAKYGKCGTCGRRVSALADEDFECCEPEQEEGEERQEPSAKMVIIGNHDQKGFSVKDIVIAMMGQGWRGIETLRYELRTFGFDYVMSLDKETLIHILKELEEDNFVEVYWDTERVRRIEVE